MRRTVDDGGSSRGRGARGRTIEKVTNVLVAVLAMTATIVVAGLWWFPLTDFLVLELLQPGHGRPPTTGAVWYDAIYVCAWSAVPAVIALVGSTSAPVPWLSLALVALTWVLLIGVDRVHGYRSTVCTVPPPDRAGSGRRRGACANRVGHGMITTKVPHLQEVTRAGPDHLDARGEPSRAPA